MGKSGETYAIDLYKRMVTQSRFDSEITSQEIESPGVLSALNRQNISGRFKNYRGEDVIGYYHWLDEPKIIQKIASLPICGVF